MSTIVNARSLVALDARLSPAAQQFCVWLAEQGIPVQITSGRRSSLKQRQIYERYLRGESGGLPALPPGRSLHEHGLAWDMVVVGVPRPRSPRDPYAPLYAAIGAAWKSMGGQWGGDAPVGYDPVHFQAKQLL
jgi:D-alanyl-D-alanine carboxypeptidase